MASFWDMLNSMRSDPQAINQQYGIPNQDLNLARSGALQDLSLQLLAMGQEMTPDQRARVMANMKSPIGGYMDSINSARQNQMLRQRMQMEQQDQLRATLGRQELEQQIQQRLQQNPQDPYARRALGFIAAGDLNNAAGALNPEPPKTSYTPDPERGILIPNQPGQPWIPMQGPQGGAVPSQAAPGAPQAGGMPQQGGEIPIGPNGLPMTPKEIQAQREAQLEEQGRQASKQREYEVANQAAKEIDQAIGILDNDQGPTAFGYRIPVITDMFNASPAGPMAEDLANIPVLGAFTDARKMRNVLDGIADKTGLKALLEAKATSPTGASGFGALSGRELAVLQNSYANIRQGLEPEKLRENLLTVRRLLLKAAQGGSNEGGKSSRMRFDANGNMVQ